MLVASEKKTVQKTFSIRSVETLNRDLRFVLCDLSRPFACILLTLPLAFRIPRTMLFQQLVSSLGCARAWAGRGVAEGPELTVVADVAGRAKSRSRAMTHLGFPN
jgi:hypothetical protein